jgi:hypothetical protein
MYVVSTMYSSFLQACQSRANGDCPDHAIVTFAHFAVRDCTSGTATVTFTTPLMNGDCKSVELSWITLAAVDPTSGSVTRCYKAAGQNSTWGGVVTLENVPCNSKVVVYAHDGSFKKTGIDVDAVLPDQCRDNSGKAHCGPYGELTVDCNACSVVMQPPHKFHRYKFFF